MKRKVFYIILAILTIIGCVLAFSGCGKNDGDYVINKENKLKWGMTVNQVKRVEKFSKDNEVIDEDGKTFLIGYPVVYTKDGHKLECNLASYFFNDTGNLDGIVYELPTSFNGLKALGADLIGYGEPIVNDEFLVDLGARNAVYIVWRSEDDTGRTVATLEYLYWDGSNPSVSVDLNREIWPTLVLVKSGKD